MSASSVYDIAMGYNAPPGLVHPLLQENYAWVDERLRINQYSFEYDCDDCELGIPLRPCPITWVDYRLDHIAKGIEEFEEPIVYKRKRAESDIFDHEEELVTVFKKMKLENSKFPIAGVKYIYEPLSNPFCNLDCEHYNYKCSLIGQDDNEELEPELSELFENWNSVKNEEDEDSQSVKCEYFDSDDDDYENEAVLSYISADEMEREVFEDMMDGYDSDEWYINLA